MGVLGEGGTAAVPVGSVVLYTKIKAFNGSTRVEPVCVTFSVAVAGVRNEEFQAE